MSERGEAEQRGLSVRRGGHAAAEAEVEAAPAPQKQKQQKQQQKQQKQQKQQQNLHKKGTPRRGGLVAIICKSI